MKTAIQTILWGQGPDIPKMLSEIAEIGYKGVEVAQHPEELGDPIEFGILLENHGLEFVGISSGSLQERVDFAGALPPKYVYVESWSHDEQMTYGSSGLVFALHTHMFKPVQTAAEAKSLLGRFPKLQFLPDTAHLKIAGEDIVSVLGWGLEKAPAIHLKDWLPDYGRSYHFYSEGFVGLGEGRVELAECGALLKEKKFNGWIVVEQDNPIRCPKEDAQESMKWLCYNRLH